MQFVPPPQPSLNGGLYTGQPFAPGAPWANVPVTPEGTYMTHVNLRSAHPPPGASHQYAGSIRPGNNLQQMPGVSMLSDKHAALCLSQPSSLTGCRDSWETSSSSPIFTQAASKANSTSSMTADPRFASFYHYQSK